MLHQDPLRFLLADDAGAGKTIMTGLYVREMLMRGRIRRVLVIPPAGLVGNWERELRTLFRLHFRIVAGSDTRSRNPFAGPRGDLAIVSLDTIRGETAFAALAEADTAPYDLVVFDEAHKLSATAHRGRMEKTRRYKLAEALASCLAAPEYTPLTWSARHLLLLTATPHMGKDSPYHHLWRLLDHRVFGAEEAFRRFPRSSRPRYFIRRTKEEMLDFEGRPLFRERLCDTFGYDLTPGPDGERTLYDRTTSYLRHSYNLATGNQQAAKLAMGVFQRRLASSTWALLKSFERRIEKVRALIADLEAGRIDSRGLRSAQTALDSRYQADYFDQHDAADDLGDDGARERHEDYEDAVLGAVVAVTVDELRDEIQTLHDLRGRARRLIQSGRESKFERLREVLEDPGHSNEKWLVFSEHRDTVDYLVTRLEALGYAGQVTTIHGTMPWEEREEQVELFRDPAGARFLVATDAAGEGINLQFCRLMVNYDVPWNPARLEQRMGRIHRYGQKYDVRIVNLVSAGTREGRVLRVLLERLDAIRDALRSDKVFLAHALVLPPTGDEEREVFNADVEKIAMGIAAEWERDRGATVKDVSTPPLARMAGLGDHPGFDLLAVYADGEKRHIEVKGRAGRSGVWLEDNEFRAACNLGKEYWLYVVLDCVTSAPQLVRVRDPFTRLVAKETTRMRISVGEVLGAAEVDG